MRRACLLAAVGCLVLPVRQAAAHDVDVTSVARVFLDEIGDRRYVLSVVDTQVPPITDPGAVLPSDCTPIEDAGVRVVSGFAFACDSPLDADDTLLLPWSLAGVVVVARWGDGSEASVYFRGSQGRVPVPLGDLRAAPGSRGRVAGTYLGLGAEHILLGVDHLLFVLGLLLLVRGLAALVMTVTAFTVAHSITLGASVFGLIPLDRAPIEAAIALSIVLLAREIVVAERGVVHLTHRMPWLVAFVFGLLHGLGFAGALSEIGWPAGRTLVALLAFNAGVELGQLAVIGLALVALAAFTRLNVPRRGLEQVLSGAIAVVALVWTVERVLW